MPRAGDGECAADRPRPHAERTTVHFPAGTTPSTIGKELERLSLKSGSSDGLTELATCLVSLVLAPPVSLGTSLTIEVCSSPMGCFAQLFSHSRNGSFPLFFPIHFNVRIASIWVLFAGIAGADESLDVWADGPAKLTVSQRIAATVRPPSATSPGRDDT